MDSVSPIVLRIVPAKRAEMMDAEEAVVFVRRVSLAKADFVSPVALRTVVARCAVRTVVAAAAEAVRRDLVVRMRDSAKMYPDV